MWFIGVELEQETSAPPPQKNPGSALICSIEDSVCILSFVLQKHRGTQRLICVQITVRRSKYIA